MTETGLQWGDECLVLLPQAELAAGEIVTVRGFTVSAVRVEASDKRAHSVPAGELRKLTDAERQFLAAK